MRLYKCQGQKMNVAHSNTNSFMQHTGWKHYLLQTCWMKTAAVSFFQGRTTWTYSLENCSFQLTMVNYRKQNEVWYNPFKLWSWASGSRHEKNSQLSWISHECCTARNSLYFFLGLEEAAGSVWRQSRLVCCAHTVPWTAGSCSWQKTRCTLRLASTSTAKNNLAKEDQGDIYRTAATCAMLMQKRQIQIQDALVYMLFSRHRWQLRKLSFRRNQQDW